MSKTFLIGSCEPFSGKSALVLGIARNLIASNHLVRFGKPLATSLELNISEGGDIKDMIDDDVSFVGETLKLSSWLSSVLNSCLMPPGKGNLLSSTFPNEASKSSVMFVEDSLFVCCF